MLYTGYQALANPSKEHRPRYIDLEALMSDIQNVTNGVIIHMDKEGCCKKDESGNTRFRLYGIVFEDVDSAHELNQARAMLLLHLLQSISSHGPPND